MAARAAAARGSPPAPRVYRLAAGYARVLQLRIKPMLARSEKRSWLSRTGPSKPSTAAVDVINLNDTVRIAHWKPHAAQYGLRSAARIIYNAFPLCWRERHLRGFKVCPHIHPQFVFISSVTPVPSGHSRY